MGSMEFPIIMLKRENEVGHQMQGNERSMDRVPYFVRWQFPKDHPIPSSDSGSSSDLDVDVVIPSGAPEVQYKVVDGKPGLYQLAKPMHGLL